MSHSAARTGGTHREGKPCSVPPPLHTDAESLFVAAATIKIDEFFAQNLLSNMTENLSV